jgi:hypothetical protein
MNSSNWSLLTWSKFYLFKCKNLQNWVDQFFWNMQLFCKLLTNFPLGPKPSTINKSSSTLIVCLMEKFKNLYLLFVGKITNWTLCPFEIIMFLSYIQIEMACNLHDFSWTLKTILESNKGHISLFLWRAILTWVVFQCERQLLE